MKNYYKVFDSLSEEQLIQAIRLTFNFRAIKDMYYHFTVSSMDNQDDPINKDEINSYVRLMKLAKKQVK